MGRKNPDERNLNHQENYMDLRLFTVTIQRFIGVKFSAKCGFGIWQILPKHVKRQAARFVCPRATVSAGRVNSRTSPRHKTFGRSCAYKPRSDFLLLLSCRQYEGFSLVLANVPFALIGGNIALHLTGINFGISAGVVL